MVRPTRRNVNRGCSASDVTAVEVVSDALISQHNFLGIPCEQRDNWQRKGNHYLKHHSQSPHDRSSDRELPAPALVYLRVRCESRSTTNVELARQRSRCERLARERGAVIVGEYRDHAGTRDDRPGLQTLLERLKQSPHVRYLLVADHARLTRRINHMAALLAELDRLGVTLVTPGSRCGIDHALLHSCSTCEIMGVEGDSSPMDEKQAKRLGALIKKRREAGRLSLRDLSELTGIDDGLLSRTESGSILKPPPERLGALSKALDIPLAELYRMAGFPTPPLPSMRPYLRTKYGELPEEARQQLETYFERLAKRHGVDLSGPAPGEDEAPLSRKTIKTTKKKGGTR